MSETQTGARSRHAPLLEVRLHALSPFAPLINGALVAVLLYGGYVLIALNTGQEFLDFTDAGVRIDQGAWIAFVLSLVFAAAVTMPALGHAEWQRALPDLKATLDAEGQQLASALAIGPARDRIVNVAFAFGVGLIGGAAFTLWLMRGTGLSVAQIVGSTWLWFVLVQPVLFGLGARAALLLGDDDKAMARLVRGHAQIDLVKIEALQVYGRLALRGALSWLILAAIILLFFVFAATMAVSIGSLVLALGAGIYAFTSTIGPVVAKASQVRDQHLLEVRTEIAKAGEQTLSGQTPPTPLSDLVAYEAWLEKRPVWPISAPITRRLALYGLIPVIAWFGAAAAEILLVRLAP